MWAIQKLMGLRVCYGSPLNNSWILSLPPSAFSVAEMSSGKLLRIKFSSLERGDGCERSGLPQ